MKRLALIIAFLLIAPPISMASETSDIPCDGEWVSGPFYITICGWWECPTWYPPSHSLLVEHCTSNGLIRIPKKYRSEKGNYIDLYSESISDAINKIDNNSKEKQIDANQAEPIDIDDGTDTKGLSSIVAWDTQEEALKHCKEPYQLCVGGGCWICP